MPKRTSRLLRERRRLGALAGPPPLLGADCSAGCPASDPAA